jgi:hypothetical protein
MELYASAGAEGEMKHRPILNFTAKNIGIITERSAPVLELLADEDQPLLVGRYPLCPEYSPLRRREWSKISTNICIPPRRRSGVSILGRDRQLAKVKASFPLEGPARVTWGLVLTDL